MLFCFPPPRHITELGGFSSHTIMRFIPRHLAVLVVHLNYGSYFALLALCHAAVCSCTFYFFCPAFWILSYSYNSVVLMFFCRAYSFLSCLFPSAVLWFSICVAPHNGLYLNQLVFYPLCSLRSFNFQQRTAKLFCLVLILCPARPAFSHNLNLILVRFLFWHLVFFRFSLTWT